MRALTIALSLALTPVAAVAHGEGHSHDHGHDHDDHSDHLAEAEGVRLIHAWTNATRDDVARVFIEIENTSETDIVLTGGDAEIATSVRLMGAPVQAGATDPVEIGTFPIAAGADITLAPDGLYLELSGLDRRLEEGDEFEMHVDLEPIGEVEINVEVESANARNHSHAGHNH